MARPRSSIPSRPAIANANNGIDLLATTCADGDTHRKWRLFFSPFSDAQKHTIGSTIVTAVFPRFFVIAALAILTTIPQAPALASGNANVLFGFKRLDNDWGDLDVQGTAGLVLDFRGASWPVSIAVDYLGSYAYDNETFDVPGIGFIDDDWEAYTSELDIGLRKHWYNSASITPFFGGGLAIMYSELEAKTDTYSYVRDSDFGLGFWLSGGFYWNVSQSFNVGIDARLSRGKVKLFDEELQSGGLYFGLLLGYRWGG